VTLYILTLRLPIPIPLKYPARGCFPDGGSFTLEKHGAGKVRGQSVDITTKCPDHSGEVRAKFVPENMGPKVRVELTQGHPYRFLSLGG